MKQLLRHAFAALAGLLCTTATLAQTPAAVPNSTFETWVSRNSVEVPQGWVTTDDFIPFSSLAPAASFLIPTGTTTKATAAHGGSFAAQIQNVLKVTPVGSAVLPGILQVASRVNPNSSSVIGGGGIPYTSRPSRLQFWYKLTGANALSDSAAVAIGLLKTQGGETAVVAFDAILLTPTPDYKLFDLPLTYYESFAPDTLELYFTSGLSGVAITAGTTLTVDDIVLTSAVTATRNPAAEAALHIYPNPSSSGEFSLASLGSAATATAPYTVTDVTGRVVLRQQAAPASASRGRLVNLQGQKAGVYVLRLDTPDGPLTRKLVIE
jgi:hypothetical protein